MRTSHLIKKILIANRGEIALRVIRTCQRLGIGTVAVYSDADENSLFVSLADEAVHLGASPSLESYLHQEKIIAACKRTQANAIHPGYGFLSENAEFAQLCEQHQIIFIGPSPHAIEKMGSKIRAKQIMEEYHVPTIPGYEGKDQRTAVLAAEAKKIGFPVLLKASAGGGGKGMRVVREESQLIAAIESAKREAKSGFGDDTLLIEKYFDSVRHIEFQIFGDTHGNLIHCFERECSIQRRHQKIMEETPSVIMTEPLRSAMGKVAVQAGKAIEYVGAGTVEFIVDHQNAFYFLEVNTRLQVEHPITEMITGLDLVEMQIQVAQGEPLPVTQEDLRMEGHSIECRLYAEDPEQDFLPRTGRIVAWEPVDGAGIRYDTGVMQGTEISMFYDPMIAKLIVHAPNRSLALQRMKDALSKTVLLGVQTNQRFLLQILQHPDFQQGDFSTHFIDEHFTTLQKTPFFSPTDCLEMSIVCLLFDWQQRERQRTALAHIPAGWRNVKTQRTSVSFEIQEEIIALQYEYVGQERYSIWFNEQHLTAKLLGMQNSRIRLVINGIQREYTVIQQDAEFYLHHPIWGTASLHKVPRFKELQLEEEKGRYLAPMPGKIIKVFVKEQQQVNSGDALLIMESMKMENTIYANADGLVQEVYVQEGRMVEADTKLIAIE